MAVLAARFFILRMIRKGFPSSEHRGNQIAPFAKFGHNHGPDMLDDSDYQQVEAIEMDRTERSP